MRILTLTTKAHGGGAERVALDLARKLGEMGHETHVRVRADQPAEPPLVSPVPFRKSDLSLGKKIAYYGRRLVQELGVELISAPTLPYLFKDLPFEPDIIHLHNFRENFLRLADLEALCRRAPVVWTWHDMWPITGHCAYSLDCERYRTGCRRCPYPKLYVPMRYDFSRSNQAKRFCLYERIARRLPGRLHVVCPSRWLLNLAEGIGNWNLTVNHIDNGIDTGVFWPPTLAQRKRIRRNMGIPLNSVVVLFAANRGQANPFKDYDSLRKAMDVLQTQREDLYCLTVGDSHRTHEKTDKREISLGTLNTPSEMADAYRAADIYVLSTRADNQPLTVLEAMACGLPVVGSRVGGVIEMLEDGRTGILVTPGDVSELREAVAVLAQSLETRLDMGNRGLAVAQREHSLGRMSENYANLYGQIAARAGRIEL